MGGIHEQRMDRCSSQSTRGEGVLPFVLRVFVKHDWNVFVDWNHFRKRFPINEFLCSLARDIVAERPVRVIDVNQTLGVLEIWLARVDQALPPKVHKVQVTLIPNFFQRFSQPAIRGMISEAERESIRYFSKILFRWR